MSQENVTTVRLAYEAWNAGDMSALGEFYAPDAIIVRSLEGWPEVGVIAGREAVIGYFGQLRDTWDNDTLEPIGNLIEAGDRVVVRQLWKAEGQGPKLSMEFTAIYTLRDEKLFLVEYFWSHAEALKTLGLSEQDAHATRPRR